MGDVYELLRAQPALYTFFLAVFGAIAGSFASAAAYRIPREGMSILKPARSHCPVCDSQIAWYDNLPLISYLVLRGRCRRCKAGYGPGYMVHELGLALLFVVAGRGWAAEQGLIPLIVVLVALTSLWIAAAVDFRHFILPDGITIGGQIAAIPAVLLVPELHLWAGRSEAPWGAQLLGLGLEDGARTLALASGLVGWAAAFAITFGIGRLFSYLLRQEALGFGDVKYLAAVGAWLGLEGALWSLLIGVFAGSLFGVINVIRMICAVRRRRRARGAKRHAHNAIRVGWLVGRVIPFGPPLILGTTLVLLAPGFVHHFFSVSWPEWISGSSHFANHQSLAP
ncbi:MAG: prepilin peptidase [Planctomycetota bacterium]|nr:prepilin peptidase [Planctomycetota bacterium]